MFTVFDQAGDRDRDPLFPISNYPSQPPRLLPHFGEPTAPLSPIQATPSPLRVRGAVASCHRGLLVVSDSLGPKGNL